MLYIGFFYKFDGGIILVTHSLYSKSQTFSCGKHVNYSLKSVFMANQELWEKALASIELSISQANFSTWFKNTIILSLDGGHIVIGVPNGFAKEWLENKYQNYILTALREIEPSISGMSCSVYNPQTYTPPTENSELPPETTPTPQQPNPHAQKESVVPQFSPQKNTHNLNERYTFDNFVVGEHNELAKAACVAVSENLGKIYNPLFIYGHVGLGKTHLLQSIGNALIKKDPQKRVIYITSERFTTELVESIKSNTANHFKDRYTNIDLLIIDDVQFLQGKDKTQQEFFHIFNSLHQQDKQIVISSDRNPKAITTLEERLRSRFEGGMIVDVGSPDLETRFAILREKAEIKGFYVSEDTLRFVAENIKNNVRELEGALNRIIAFSELKKQEPTMELAQAALAEIIESSKKKAVQSKDVVAVISSFYEVSPEELIVKGRKKEVVHPRQVAMYLLRKELNMSYPGIGKYFGGRDHTTALHAYEKIHKLAGEDSRFSEELSFLVDRLYTV